MVQDLVGYLHRDADRFTPVVANLLPFEILLVSLHRASHAISFLALLRVLLIPQICIPKTALMAQSGPLG